MNSDEMKHETLSVPGDELMSTEKVASFLLAVCQELDKVAFIPKTNMSRAFKHRAKVKRSGKFKPDALPDMSRPAPPVKSFTAPKPPSL